MSKYCSGDEEEEDDELRDFSGEPELDPDLTDKRFEQGESSSSQRRSGEDRVDRCVPGGGAECDLPEDRTPEIISVRLDREKTEKMPRQRHLVMETNLKEMVKRSEDRLHEDLNRVKYQPYIEANEAKDRPDEEMTDEHWRNHLACNDSIIVDVCQGQYRSKLVCPACKKLSITFDPFMYLSLPLPSTTMRSMTLTDMSTDGSTLPFPVIVTVPKYGRCKDLVQALSTTCSLRDDEKLLVAEVSKEAEERHVFCLPLLFSFADTVVPFNQFPRLYQPSEKKEISLKQQVSRKIVKIVGFYLSEDLFSLGKRRRLKD
ncbi:Ubiquitin carboxyl-terminal hydrolase 8 [Camellia lanceoleosa]|uniref:Ubiquitin carboxyl-terminal hydrolase 8 n=1 Tax=Camellia lanceoleosa TaxID=1840588 RepID=A0ACC0HMV7_9ERIC|nr:Ubiquitin carboxyl-terminal hydrolase 8 [Camellia lanceoleosa]